MWRYQVFARKLPWHFIGVYIIKTVTYASLSFYFYAWQKERFPRETYEQRGIYVKWTVRNFSPILIVLWPLRSKMHCGNSRCDWSITWPLSNMTRSLARGRNFKFQHRHHLPNGPQVISIQILTELYQDQIWIAPSLEICPEMHALAKMAELVNNRKIVNKISNEMV